VKPLHPSLLHRLLRKNPLLGAQMWRWMGRRGVPEGGD
jgi:hypothetical protein